MFFSSIEKRKTITNSKLFQEVEIPRPTAKRGPKGSTKKSSHSGGGGGSSSSRKSVAGGGAGVALSGPRGGTQTELDAQHVLDHFHNATIRGPASAQFSHSFSFTFQFNSIQPNRSIISSSSSLLSLQSMSEKEKLPSALKFISINYLSYSIFHTPSSSVAVIL